MSEDNMRETITISLAEYNELVADQKFLGALRAAGVDNWSGFDDAVDLYEEDGDAE